MFQHKFYRPGRAANLSVMSRREYRIVGLDGPETLILTSLKAAQRELKWREQREDAVADFADILGVEPEPEDVYWIEVREVEPWQMLERG